MAFIVSKDGVITMNKGDDAFFDVEIYMSMSDADGKVTEKPYEMQDGDTLTLTVRRRPDEDCPVEFSVTSNTNRLEIVPEDTREMKIGKYSADIQLNYGGKKCTVFPLLHNLSKEQLSLSKNWENFILVGEVTK